MNEINNNKKMYIVSLENDVESTYAMCLSEEQVRVFEWFANQGYEVEVTPQSNVIIL